MTEPLTSLCRNCLASHDGDLSGERCEKCGSPRIVRHSELHNLTIAHIDCDAFYASVEKRDNPSLADKPVIIGGGQRGVVAAACYVARLYGIRSAMPMFKAKQACPDAVVIRPNMAKYKAVGEQIRDLMREVTPLVQPLSIDEAFLDLTDVVAEGIDSAAMRLAALVLRIEQKIGVNTSIGLSYNKFLAKIASDLDKPRGFAVIGRAEACDFLADKPVGMLWESGAHSPGSYAETASQRSANCNKSKSRNSSRNTALLDRASIISRVALTPERSSQIHKPRVFPPRRHSKAILAMRLHCWNVLYRYAVLLRDDLRIKTSPDRA